MRFKKIYIEISNICNLNCSFCPKTKRLPKRMDIYDFKEILIKIKPYTDYIYLHLMGEPLFHPNLKSFLDLAYEFNLKVIITTNGTLLTENKEILLNASALHKINISLHAFEANGLAIPFTKYIDDCLSFGLENNGNKIINYRLWNNGGKNELNNEILKNMKNHYPNEWISNRNGFKIKENTYLEYGDKFDWPDSNNETISDKVFCYGLRDQIGILVDGSVVPCCLDHEGEINLGNIFTSNLEDIITSKKALAIYNGFSNKNAVESLCTKCGFATRLNKK